MQMHFLTLILITATSVVIKSDIPPTLFWGNKQLSQVLLTHASGHNKMHVLEGIHIA